MKKAEKDYKKQMDVSIKKHRKEMTKKIKNLICPLISMFRLLTKSSSISGSTVAPSPSFVGF
jgi:hypothetical protein